MTTSRFVVTLGNRAQVCFAPLHVGASVVGVHLIESRSLERERSWDRFPLVELESARREWWEALRAHWIIWCPAHLINARLVPPHWQTLFANAAAVVWNAQLSRATHKEAPQSRL